MNDFLINYLIGDLDIEERIEFMRKCSKLLLNDEIFIKDSYVINSINLTFTLLVSICNYYLANSTKNNFEISERLKRINLKRLYFLVAKKLSEEEKKTNKIVIENLYKEYYVFCEKCNWNESLLFKSREKAKNIDNIYNKKFTFSEIVILNELRVEQIIEYGSFYAKEMLGKNRNKKIRQLMNTDNYEFFYMLLTEKDNQKIIEYLNDNYHTFDLNKIKKLIPKFIQNYSIIENIDEQKRLENIEKKLEIMLETTIVNILNEIRNSLNIKKSSINNVSIKTENETCQKRAKKIVKLYIDGNYRNIKHFCKDLHMGISTFNSYIKLVKQIDEELYNQIEERLKMQSSRNISILNNELSKIVYFIKNGVELEDGRVKEFDILDYCKLINLSLENMRCFLNKSNLEMEDLKLIRKFLMQYRNFKMITKNYIYNEKNIVLVNDISHEVTIEEKEKVIEYLENNKIPLLNVTYNTALKRFLSNDLNVKQKKIII